MPEIEHLKRSLEPLLTKAKVRQAILHRRDILTVFDERGAKRVKGANARISPAELLVGARISHLDRWGKNLAIVSESGRVMGIHLGMSGQLRFVPAGEELEQADHVHCEWLVESPRGRGRLIFRDPRRFGGLWSYPSLEALREDRWSKLGPDALTVSGRELAERLRSTRRPIKAALLEQSILAGVGNIYADEALFAAKIDPASPAFRIPKEEAMKLAAAIRRILKAAVDSGGSTIRSYLDAQGKGGEYAARHQVYGRGGEPCQRCGEQLAQAALAQRTTVWCPQCQRLFV